MPRRSNPDSNSRMIPGSRARSARGREREDQMAADPHGGAEQVKRHEQTICHVLRKAAS